MFHILPEPTVKIYKIDQHIIQRLFKFFMFLMNSYPTNELIQYIRIKLYDYELDLRDLNLVEFLFLWDRKSNLKILKRKI